MNLQQFFTALRTGDLTTEAPVIFLRGNQDYPLLLCALIIDRLRAVTGVTIDSLDLQLHDEVSIASKWATSFLGMRSYYWLHNIALLDGAKRKHCEALLQSYEGPHCLIFFSSQDTMPGLSSRALIVDIPEACSKEDFLALVAFCEGSKSENVLSFAHTIFSQVNSIPFDTACVLMRYATLLGSHQSVFTKRWLGQLVYPERSLFTLSQYLFAKNERAFFRAWSEVAQEYSDVFWTSFWSEQLWRASVYIKLMHNNNRVEADKVGFRLPFSFKNKEWRRWDPAELTGAHTFLTATDVILKNGGELFHLELFYAKVLEGDFAAK